MNANSPAPCCGSCDCYRPDSTQLLVGICKCLPPVPMFVNQGGTPGLISVSPPVPAAGYCHQWRAPASPVPSSFQAAVTAGLGATA